MQLNASATILNNKPIIIITLGLLKKIGNDYDSLAAVIGHEFAHLKLNHHSSQQASNAIIDILGIVALAAIDSSWGGAQYNPYRDLHKFGLDTAKTLAKKAHSRDDEYDADAKGVEYMLRAGFLIEGAYRIHNNIIPANSSWFDTHPSSSDRISYIQKISKNYSSLIEKNKIKKVSDSFEDTNSIQTKKNTIEYFKKKCSEIGFIEKTENFGLCVLKLHENSH